MDITKLEELSCLKIPSAYKEKVEHSLDGIVQMLHSIDNIQLPQKNPNYNQVTTLATDNVENDYLIDKDNTDLHIVDGLFLAPKVIHKD